MGDGGGGGDGGFSGGSGVFEGGGAAVDDDGEFGAVGDGGVVCVDTLVNPGFSVLYFSGQYLLHLSRATYNPSGTIISDEPVTLTNPD